MQIPIAHNPTTYVNHAGRAVSVAPPPARSKPKSQKGPYHAGWLVMGVSPEHMAVLRQQHERKNEGKPFDANLALRTAKLQRVRSKPYELFSAADQCADLARKAGWLGVHVVEKAKA